MSEIILCGDGIGIKTVYDGLKEYYDTIELLTNTPQILSIRKSDSFLNSFEDSNIKLVLSSGYAPLIDCHTLQTKTFLNIHYALLPRFRGMHPVVWGILNGEEYLGWTLHEMDEEMDSGPIIYQYKSKNIDQKTSQDYMMEFGRTITDRIGVIMNDYTSGRLHPVSQPTEGIIWGAKRNLNDCQIDFNSNADSLRRFFRALVRPYPLPFLVHRNEKLFVEDNSYFISDGNAVTNGRVCNLDEKGAWIKISDGYLVVKNLTDIEGKNIKAINRFKIGTRL